MGTCYSYCKSIKENKPFMSPMYETVDLEHTTPFIPPITEGTVIKVYDGDTITIASKLPYPESPLYRFQVRLRGIDSPEIKGKTAEEVLAAHNSQKALEDLILFTIVKLENQGVEKYGRIIADVYSAEGLHINKWLLDNGYAISYDGKTKKPYIAGKTYVKPSMRSSVSYVKSNKTNE